MQKFLNYFLSRYFVPFALCAGFLVYFGLQQRPVHDEQVENDYHEEINSYSWLGKVPNIHGFILGSSSLRYGVSATDLAKSGEVWVNLSMDARDPAVFYQLLQKYAPQKNPSIVIVSLDPWIYSKNYYKYRKPVMLLDLNPNETINYLGTNNAVFFAKTKYFLKYQLGIVKAMNPAPLEIPQESPIPADMGSVKLKQVATNFNDVNADIFETGKYGWSDVEFLYLHKIKSYCAAHNIELIFIIPPKRTDYIEVMQQKYKNVHEQWWQKLYASVGGSKVVGHYSDLASYNQDSTFCEAYHLSAKGQEIYSGYLRQQLDSARIITAVPDIF